MCVLALSALSAVRTDRRLDQNQILRSRDVSSFQDVHKTSGISGICMKNVLCSGVSWCASSSVWYVILHFLTPKRETETSTAGSLKEPHAVALRKLPSYTDLDPTSLKTYPTISHLQLRLVHLCLGFLGGFWWKTRITTQVVRPFGRDRGCGSSRMSPKDKPARGWGAELGGEGCTRTSTRWDSIPLRPLGPPGWIKKHHGRDQPFRALKPALIHSLID